MKINNVQLGALRDTFIQIKDQKMPFKLALILAKNLAILDKEYEFYIEREREFALKFLEIDPLTGKLIESAPNVIKIKSGMEEECKIAREDLDAFENELDLHMIPMTLLENLEFTPAQLAALECLIEEE